MARITELEQIAKEKDELKAKVAKLRHNFEILKQQTQDTTNILDTRSTNDIPEQIVNITANNTIANTTTNTTSNTTSDTNTDITANISTSNITQLIHVKPKSLEDKEMDDFHDSIYKETV
ncbi:4331_t:CDS:1, partial [Diversispora eburnea]